MIKKVFNFCATIIVILVVIVAVLLGGLRIFGLKPYAVLSPSMTPRFQTGDLVYVGKTEPEKIDVGDVLTFSIGSGKTVTHRVVMVDRDAQTFTTKGDANSQNDVSPVSYKDVIGTVKFSLPKLGYLAYSLSTSKGKYIALMTICGIFLLLLLPDIVSGTKRKQK